MGESVIASDSLAFNTSRDTHVGTCWIETVIVGTEQDPAPFLKILQGAASCSAAVGLAHYCYLTLCLLHSARSGKSNATPSGAICY